MTEEHPIEDIDEYQFPDKYFRQLREYEDRDTGLYSVVTGNLWREMLDEGFSEDDAWEVNYLLHDYEIDEAEDLVYEVLDDDRV